MLALGQDFILVITSLVGEANFTLPIPDRTVKHHHVIESVKVDILFQKIENSRVRFKCYNPPLFPN
jgi:hypothetical protein